MWLEWEGQAKPDLLVTLTSEGPDPLIRFFSVAEI